MGCKGILVLDPTMGKQTDIILRESQKKFNWNMNTIKGSGRYREIQNGQRGRIVGVCRRGESRPFIYGRLIKQYVLLLSAVGIKDQVLLEIQREHFDRLRK